MSVDKKDLEIIYLLSVFFKQDYEKVAAWLETPNPNFGEITPLTLMRRERSHKVLNFIKAQKEDGQW